MIDILHIIGIYLYFLFADTLDQVTLTCSAQGTVLFWRSEAFGEITMHNASAPTIYREQFRAEIVSYDKNQSCLVSSLSFCATASRNGTTVTCATRNKTSNQPLSLHIMSSKSVRHFLVVDKLHVYVLIKT